MESKIMRNRSILECACGSFDHLLVIDYEYDYYGEYEPAICFYFSSNHRLSFFRRLLVCIKYLFKKEPFVWNDTVIFDDRNMEELQKCLDSMKNAYKFKEKQLNENN